MPRSPWPEGAQKSRGLSEQPHQLFKGTHEWNWIGSDTDATQLPVPSAGQTPRAEDSVHSGPAAHLLLETGRLGSSSSDCGENLYGYSSLLK